MALGNQHLVARGAYRARQFWQAIWAGPLSAQARREVNGLLSDRQRVLFNTQSDAGQQHGYRVMRTLRDAGHDQPDLLVAALLHDAGKYRVRYTWFDRVKVVLTRRFAPQLEQKWSTGSQTGWRRAYAVKAAHPEWGANALAEAGGSDLSVALVRRHQETPVATGKSDEESRLLVLLQWADDQN